MLRSALPGAVVDTGVGGLPRRATIDTLWLLIVGHGLWEHRMEISTDDTVHEVRVEEGVGRDVRAIEAQGMRMAVTVGRVH